MLVRKPTSGQWYNANGAFNLPTDVTEDNVKNYVISATAVTDSRFEKSNADSSTYTARYVISPSRTSLGTKERFFVMGLEDITYGNEERFYWYNKAGWTTEGMSDFETATSIEFGKGKDNTAAMIAKWDAGSGTGGYGDRDDLDIWKHVKAKQAEYSGWFVPSNGEWGAFVTALGITGSNYSDYNLRSTYWASSQKTKDRAFRAGISWGYIDDLNVSGIDYLRLSTIF